jgi:hypothetical protein
MFLQIRILITQINLPSLGPHIRKSVKNMRNRINRKILWLIISSINIPINQQQCINQQYIHTSLSVLISINIPAKNVPIGKIHHIPTSLGRFHTRCTIGRSTIRRRGGIEPGRRRNTRNRRICMISRFFIPIYRSLRQSWTRRRRNIASFHHQTSKSENQNERRPGISGRHAGVEKEQVLWERERERERERSNRFREKESRTLQSRLALQVACSTCLIEDPHSSHRTSTRTYVRS